MMTVKEEEGVTLGRDDGRKNFYLQFNKALVVVLIVAAGCILHKTRTRIVVSAISSNYSFVVRKQQHYDSVPFVVSKEPDWKVLRKSLDVYRGEARHALEQLSVALEVVLAEESRVCTSLKFSDHLQDKIHRLSDLYDKDLETLQQLVLVPFPTTLALPDYAYAEVLTSQPNRDNVEEKEQQSFTWWSGSPSRRLLEDQRPYDSGRQVVAHLVRDWSASEGAPIRASIYSWCVEQLKIYPPKGPVMVPGAGLGRLAWELATNLGCFVEAVESSISMAAAARAILHINKQGSTWLANSFELHPYALDDFTNEVQSSARYDSVRFPDVVPRVMHGSLSYTVGDFGYESMRHLRNYYGAVITCFFVDTSTTIYDYLTTISMILATGGVWVGLGPLQWHVNSKVPVAVDELRMIVESFCDNSADKPVFEILHWSVDTQPVGYRDHGRRQSTHFDAYCPLRFVLRKKQ